MSRMSLMAGLLAATLAWAGAAQADPWKDESGHGRRGGGEWKEESRDGGRKVERTCKGPRGRDHGVAGPVYGPGVYLGDLPMAIGPMPEIPGVACNRDLIGGLLGGAAGGLIGSQVGRGGGNTAATIGAIVGGTIGRRMDQADQACVGQALEYGRTDQAVAGRDPDGDHYQVTPTRTFGRHGIHCRDYVTQATIDGRRQRVTGTARREPDGTWRVVT